MLTSAKTTQINCHISDLETTQVNCHTSDTQGHTQLSQ